MNVQVQVDHGIAILRTGEDDLVTGQGGSGSQPLDRALRDVVAEGAAAVVLACGHRGGSDHQEPASPESHGVLLGVLHQLRRIPLTTIAALDGTVDGVWGALSLAMDLRVATPSTRIRFTAGARALPGVVSSLSRWIGDGHAMQVMVGGEALTGERADLLGLVALAPDGDHLEVAVQHARRSASGQAISGPKVRRVQRAMHELHREEVEGFEALLWPPEG